MKQALNSDEPARDVATAENLLKKHQDLGDDIAAHQDEWVKYDYFKVVNMQHMYNALKAWYTVCVL